MGEISCLCWVGLDFMTAPSSCTKWKAAPFTWHPATKPEACRAWSRFPQMEQFGGAQVRAYRTQSHSVLLPKGGRAFHPKRTGNHSEEETGRLEGEGEGEGEEEGEEEGSPSSGGSPSGMPHSCRSSS